MSSAFETTVKNIGVVKDGSATTVNFKLEQGAIITSSGASCGCTTPKFNKETNELEVTYNASKPKSVPTLNISKTIWADVKRSDGSTVRNTLTIEGVVA